MWYYIVTFIVSLFFIHLANKVYGQQKVVFGIFYLLGLLPPILLAGFRANCVGSDMDFYIMPIFTEVRYFDKLSDFVDSRPNTEYNYLLLNWIIAKFSKSPYVLLTIIHMLIIVPMSVVAFKLRKVLSPVLFFYIFYMVFYQDSLTIVRQAIAIGLTTLAFTYYIERKYCLYIMLELIAFGFHNTAILTLLYPLILLTVKKYPIWGNTKKYIIAAFIATLLVINLNLILLYFINSGLLNAKYLIYTLLGDTFESGLGATNFVVKICIIIYIYMFKKIYGLKNTRNIIVVLDFFFVLSLMDLALSLFALLMEPLDRFSLYPRLMTCISLPYLFRLNNIRKKNAILNFCKLSLILILAAYWWYVYMNGDMGQTAIYKMRI